MQEKSEPRAVGEPRAAKIQGRAEIVHSLLPAAVSGC